MTQLIAFTFYETPRGHTRTGFSGHAYTSKASREFIKRVRNAASDTMRRRGIAPLHGALRMAIRARFKVPNRTPKALRAAMLEGRVFPTRRPDSDNIAKGIKDALNKVAYGDDSQVVKLIVEKVYAETAGLDVVIEYVGEGSSRVGGKADG